MLKTKYSQMRRDFDRQLQDLAKQALKVKGQEFVLDAQIKIHKEQTQELKKQEAEFQKSRDESLFSLTKTKNDNLKNQNQMEADNRDLINNHNREE